MNTHVSQINLGFPTFAVGAMKKILDGIPVGIVRSLEVSVTGTIKNNADANSTIVTNLNEDMTQEGDDDLDRVGSAILALCECIIDDQSSFLFTGLSFQQLRTNLALLNRRDCEVSGALEDGSTLPKSSESAAAFGFTFRIPYALTEYCQDLDSCKQGGARARRGTLTFNGGTGLAAVTLNGAAVATVASVVIDVDARMEDGEDGYVGPYWHIDNRQGLTNNGPALGDGVRLALLDQTYSYTGKYNLTGPATLQNVSAAALKLDYQREQSNWRSTQGPALQNRCVPVMTFMPETTIDDIDPRGVPPRINAITASSLALYDVTLFLNKQVAAGLVSQEVGKGGTTTLIPKTPRSYPADARIAASRAPLLGVVINPGDVSGGSVASSPRQAAQSPLVKHSR